MGIRLHIASLLAAGAAFAAPVAPSNLIFQIGTPDASALEFGLVNERWQGYAAAYPSPIVFTVGKCEVDSWPYVHPSTRDKWAGSKPQTFTIRFHLDQLPSATQFLTIGTLAIWEPSEMTVTANGRELARRRLPSDSPLVSLANDPSGEGKPVPLTVGVPADALKAGDNELAITLNDGSWIIYDYIRLGADKTPPKLDGGTVDLLDDFLAGPMAGVEDIVFAERRIVHEHWYANFSYYSFDNGSSSNGDERITYREGGRLCRMNLRSKTVTTLLDDPKGGVRDPQVSYDGRTILFSYRKEGSKHFHLFEIGADGKGLKQLTDGDYDDLEPSYLPDGRIVFVSSRAKRWVNCWLTQVATLHQCDANGGNIRAISSNNEHDNTPWPLPDGRLLYTRWEYVDRSQVHYHHLWSANPDGSGQTVYYGNLRPGVLMIDSKPIPGTDKIVSSFSPGHGKTEHEGVITVVSPKVGPDEGVSARRITKGDDFRDPWAFSENCFMAARGPELLLVDGRGRTQELLRLSDAEAKQNWWIHEPRPLQPRMREAVIQDRMKPEEATGRMMLADVYEGRNMTGVKRGDIKKLLVLESLPKPVNFTGGMDPLSYGGTFTLERILGTVPVEPDGSAYFEVPAVRSVIFVALDENDLSVKRMQSFATVQPGETLGCIGCHEQRTLAPRVPAVALTMAAKKQAAKIEPVAGVPDVFDYPRDIQPVLNDLCVRCHDYDAAPDAGPHGGPRAGRLILSGDRGPMFSHSYYMMTIAGLFSDGRNQAKSNYEPRTLGSSASKILRMLDGSHYGVKASDQQKKMLRLWIEVGAPYPGTYAALGTGMIGGYRENQQVGMDVKWPEAHAASAVIGERCDGCHKDASRLLPKNMSDERGVSFWQPKIGDPRLNTSRHIVFNLTRPEKSMLLLAPLAKNAGGWGLCRGEGVPVSGVFASKDDPGYQALLGLCTAGRNRLAEIRRFDMKEFRPDPAYLREMRRYGVLTPADEQAVRIDPYDLDRRYWQSLWYQPTPKSGAT